MKKAGAVEAKFDLGREAGELGVASLRAVRKSRKRVQRAAKANAPVRSGALRKGIKGGEKRTPGGAIGWVAAIAPHSTVVEVGGTVGRGDAHEKKHRGRRHVRREAAPYLGPALEAEFGGLVDEMVDEVDGVIN